MKQSIPWLRDQVGQPSQNALISGGSATLTGKKSGSIKRIAPPGRALATRFSTAIRASAVKPGARRHEIEVLGRDWPGNDVAPTQLVIRHIGLDARKIEISRHGCAVGSYPPRESHQRVGTSS